MRAELLTRLEAALATELVPSVPVPVTANV